MSISGAAGVGAGGGAAGAAAGGVAGVAGASGASAAAVSGNPAAGNPSASSASSAMNGAAQPGLPGNLQSLVDAMQDFSSAEILIALMMASAANGKDDDGFGSSAAGFLAGLAMAGGLAQGSEINLNIEASGLQNPAGVAGAAGVAATGGAGLSLNVSI